MERMDWKESSGTDLGFGVGFRCSVEEIVVGIEIEGRGDEQIGASLNMGENV